MNSVIDVLLNRKSVRAYEDRPISPEAKETILQAALRAPTAGNMTLYTIIDVTDQQLKETLAQTCDDQPFIATAPLVLLFLADYQRWYDYFKLSEVDRVCQQRGVEMRRPAEGDLLLASCDALIAAQTAVIAAESLGLGSCYIGDILERFETHRELFDLPEYAMPICMVCFGYPTEQQKARKQPPRFERRFVVSENCFPRLSADDYAAMVQDRQAMLFANRSKLPADIENFGQLMYFRKFGAEYNVELNRSSHVMLQAWLAGAARDE